MTLRQALAASWVSNAGYRGAWLGDLEAIQDLEGRISVSQAKTRHTKEGLTQYVYWGLTSGQVDQVAHRVGWQPWGENRRRE